MEKEQKNPEKLKVKEVKEKPLEKNKWVAMGILVFGAFFVVIGFFLMVLSYALEYLLKDTVRDLAVESGVEVEVLFTQIFLLGFFVGLLIMIAGFLVCCKVTIMRIPKEDIVKDYLDKYFKDKEEIEKSVSFYSFPKSRLIAAIILLIMGFVDLFFLWGAIGHHNSPYGQTIVLGGPSAFYPVA